MELLRSEQTAHFMIAAFSQLKFDNAAGVVAGDQPGLLSLQDLAGILDACQEFLQQSRLGTALDGGPVDLADSVARMRQAQSKLTVVRQENQPFAIAIEAAH